jgi:hypothetical protein
MDGVRGSRDSRQDEEALFSGAFADQVQFNKARRRLETYLFVFKEQPGVQKARPYWAMQHVTPRQTDWQSAIDSLRTSSTTSTSPTRRGDSARVGDYSSSSDGWDSLPPPSTS